MAKKILVIEDNEHNLYLIRFILEANGYQVITASNGMDGINAASSNHSIDLILMDIQLPDIDGLEATQRIRSAGITLPIVALTSYALSGDKESVLKAGCNGYMSKPINTETIVSEIENYM